MNPTAADAMSKASFWEGVWKNLSCPLLMAIALYLLHGAARDLAEQMATLREGVAEVKAAIEAGQRTTPTKP